MKKIICLSFVFILVFLCGCNQNGHKTPINDEGMTFDADVDFSGETHSYSVEITPDSKAIIGWTVGKSESFKAEFSGDTVVLSHGNISDTLTVSELPSNLTFDFFYSVFRYINDNSPEVKTENSEFFINGETGKYKFTLYLGETGLPLKITESNYGITATVKNAAYK